MANDYDRLLELCGLEPEEIAREKPRLDKVFNKIGLDAEDMKKAETWVKQHHDVELEGGRKILRLWILELVDLVLAREEGKKLVYYGYPTIPGPSGAIAATDSNIFCTCPDVVLTHTLGQIFNKFNPILEAAEKNGLPPGYGLCSLQQTRVGGMHMGIVPVPDIALTSSYFCDMGSKTDELLHEKYGHPAVYIDGSMDSRWGEFPEYQPERIEFLGGQIEKALKKVENVLHIKITEEARHEGLTRGRQLITAMGELVELMRTADPQPISMVTVELVRRLSTGSSSSRFIKEGPSAVSLLVEGVKERIRKGVGVVEKGAPKIITYIGHFADPSIVRMIENTGLSIPYTSLAATMSKYYKVASSVRGSELAEQEMARGTFHSVYGFVKRMEETMRTTKVEGLIWDYVLHCRPMSLPSHLMKQVIEKETGIPVLAFEFDLVDNRTINANSLRTKVETFAEILRARRTPAPQ